MTICNSRKERDFEGNVITSPCLQDWINREHSRKLRIFVKKQSWICFIIFQWSIHKINIHISDKFPNKTSKQTSPQYEITFPKLAKKKRILSYEPLPSSSPFHRSTSSSAPPSLPPSFFIYNGPERASINPLAPTDSINIWSRPVASSASLWRLSVEGGDVRGEGTGSSSSSSNSGSRWISEEHSNPLGSRLN